MTERLERVLERYGREITVVHGGTETAARAFFQPITDKGRAAPYEMTSLGTVDDRQWRCLTRAALADGDTVVCGGARYRVDNTAEVWAGAERCHWWAVLTAEREAAT